MKTQVFDITGAKKEEITLDSSVFGITVNQSLLKEAYLRYLSNQREAAAKTKTRGERRGGGKKPWRQKGTGRARTGSRRNPIWRKGGVTFGPTGEQSYIKGLNKKQIKLSLKMALTTKTKDNRILLLDKAEIKKPKTKDIEKFINKIPAEKRILLVAEKNPVLFKSASNIPSLTCVLSDQINVFDILVSDYIIFTKNAYENAVKSLKEEVRREKKDKKKEVSRKKETGNPKKKEKPVAQKTVENKEKTKK